MATPFDALTVCNSGSFSLGPLWEWPTGTPYQAGTGSDVLPQAGQLRLEIRDDLTAFAGIRTIDNFDAVANEIFFTILSSPNDILGSSPETQGPLGHISLVPASGFGDAILMEFGWGFSSEYPENADPELVYEYGTDGPWIQYTIEGDEWEVGVDWSVYRHWRISIDSGTNVVSYYTRKHLGEGWIFVDSYTAPGDYSSVEARIYLGSARLDPAEEVAFFSLAATPDCSLPTIPGWRVTDIYACGCTLFALLEDGEARTEGGVVSNPNVIPHLARSLDGGATWTLMARVPGASDVATSTAFSLLGAAGLPDGRMFFSHFSGGGAISADSGATWTPFEYTIPGLESGQVVFWPIAHNGKFYGVRRGGAPENTTSVIKSEDGGASWSDLPAVPGGLLSAQPPFPVWAGPGTRLFTENVDGDLYYSDDEGAWVLGRAAGGYYPVDLAHDGDQQVAIMTQDGLGALQFWLSGDGGGSWTQKTGFGALHAEMGVRYPANSEHSFWRGQGSLAWAGNRWVATYVTPFNDDDATAQFIQSLDGETWTLISEASGANYPFPLVRYIDGRLFMVTEMSGGWVTQLGPGLQDNTSVQQHLLVFSGSYLCVGSAPGGPCTLEWTLYEEDGVSIRAQTTTSADWLGESGSAKPYLREPSGYGEQEVDFARGTASIGQANIRHVDPRTVEGDQDSGWFTALVPYVAGCRNRLRRYTPEGWVVIADGPGSFPQLSETFAGYTHQIRDTREKERRLKAFATAETTSILPRGIIGGFGTIPAVTPLVSAGVGVEDSRMLDFSAYWDASPANGVDMETAVIVLPEVLKMFDATKVERISEPVLGVADYQLTFGNILFLWREAGTGDPYNEVRAPVLIYRETSVEGLESGGLNLLQVYNGVWDNFGEDTTAIGVAATTAGEVWLADLPTGVDVEVLFLPNNFPPSETNPLHIDGLSAGVFLKNLYDGLYTPRDPVTGAVVSTGIRYDEAALLNMTDSVRLRITEPIKDIRDWAETNIYQPFGYAPALDSDGRVSPVSQVIPSDPAFLEALTDITNDITAPVPGHSPGDNVINLLSLEYPRAYIDAVGVGGDSLSVRQITATLPGDAYSIDRFGELPIEMESAALVAIGGPRGAKALAQFGFTVTEDGESQAFERYQNLLLRRQLGTELVVVPCMRAFTSHLRAGDWVRCKLTWIPNQDTGRRTVDHLAQILAIADLDCAWREITMELVRTWDSAFDLYDSDYGVDEYGNFDPAFLHFAVSFEIPEDNSEFVTVRAVSNVAPDNYRWRLFRSYETELVAGGDVGSEPEADVTLWLSPPAAFADLPTTETVYTFPTGLQRSEAIGTRNVRMRFRVEVRDGGDVVYDSGTYPFDYEWKYVVP